MQIADARSQGLGFEFSGSERPYPRIRFSSPAQRLSFSYCSSVRLRNAPPRPMAIPWSSISRLSPNNNATENGAEGLHRHNCSPAPNAQKPLGVERPPWQIRRKDEAMVVREPGIHLRIVVIRYLDSLSRKHYRKDWRPVTRQRSRCRCHRL
jgi:hypothetical protein